MYTHKLDCFAWDILDTAAPAGVNISSNPLVWIVEEDCLAVGHFDHQEQTGNPGYEPVDSAKRVVRSRARLRVLVENSNSAAVTLARVDEIRKGHGVLNSAQVLCDPGVVVAGIITHIQTGERRGTDPTVPGEYGMFQIGERTEAMESVKGDTVCSVWL
jgi:hypothetical protein